MPAPTMLPHSVLDDVLSPQEFASDELCLDLSKATQFCRLLAAIRQHLLISPETQSYYVNMARAMYHKLHDHGNLDSPPSHDDFALFVAQHWPTFRSADLGQGGKSGAWTIVWGRVSKGVGSVNEVQILNSIVATAGRACNRSGLSAALYELILVVIVIHEISHSFTNYLFGNLLTPQGVGPSQNGSGEYEWLVETALMGGRVVASWDHKEDVGRMSRIDRVILETDNDARVIGVDAAHQILESLGTPTMSRPSNLHLEAFTDKDFRARITEPTLVQPREVVAPVGLGFMSYVGSDRFETPYGDGRVFSLH